MLKKIKKWCKLFAVDLDTFLVWREKNGNDEDDIDHEEAVKRFNESHRNLIRARCLKLKEELKKRFADMGVKWNEAYHSSIENDSFAELIELEALMVYDLEEDSTGFKKELEENGAFSFIYPIPAAKYVMAMSKARFMTEEEIMQRKMLKEMGIEQ